MKKLVDKISVVPSKRIFLSIIADYDLNRSICELIDNAIDNSIKLPIKDLIVEINFDLEQQTISIKDNAGGIPKTNLNYILGPGQTGNLPTDKVIGIFGVGTKRAVVALSQEIRIKTRYKAEPTYMMEFDDDWLNDDKWEIDVYQADDINENSTEVFLQRLRNKVEKNEISYLENHLSRVYSRFLEKNKMKIIVDGEEIKPFKFVNWAYPPNHCPTEINGRISFDGNEVKINIVAGLTRESSPVGLYGVYFYCNDRLIVSDLKTFQVGFGKGLAGLPHPSISTLRVIVSLEGEAIAMPWNSSKSAINYEHKVFKALQYNLIELVKYYAKLSRSLEGSWPSEVFQYAKGNNTVINNITFPCIRKLNMPPIPKSRQTYADKLKTNNKKISDEKPWTRGIISGIIASDLIFDKSFEEKNRISLIILDSTLEIAFKEFLVYESGEAYSDIKLVGIFQSRNSVETEIKKHTNLSKETWKKINYFYNLRCKLIHERASVGISDERIEEYTEIVQDVLMKMFNLNFNQ